MTSAKEEPVRYLLLLWGHAAAEEALPAEERRAIVEQHMAYSARLREAGAMVLGEPVGPALIDGPFAETKEQVGGFYVIECAGDGEARHWADQVPQSPGLAVELREIPAL
jgi:hypothetical protein